jgi:hypothetical protein
MTNSNNFHPVDSVLVVKASDLDSSVANDLSIPTGKSIAELLYEEKNNKTQDQEQAETKEKQAEAT